MKLNRLCLRNPRIIKDHALQILTADPETFCYTDNYIAGPLRGRLVNDILDPALVNVLIEFPQFHPLLAENSHLDSSVYDTLIETNNTLVYSRFVEADELWSRKLTEPQMLTILQKLGKDKILEMQFQHAHNVTYAFPRRIKQIPYIKLLWYIFRNIKGTDNAHYYEEMSQNATTTLPLMLAVLEECIREKPSHTEYVIKNIMERFPKKISRVLNDNLPQLLDVNYNSKVNDLQQYIIDNKLEEVTIPDEGVR